MGWPGGAMFIPVEATDEAKDPIGWIFCEFEL